MCRNVASGTLILVALLFGAVLISAADVSIPADGLQLWLKADVGVQTDGVFVTRWEDQSGNHRDAVAGENANPMFVPGGLNANPVVRFDGAATHVIVAHDPDLNATEGLSTFIVFRWERGFRIAQKRSNASGVDPDAWFITTNGGLGVSGSFNNEKLYGDTLWHVQTGVADVEVGTISLYRNGQLLATVEGVQAQAPNSDDLFIGKRDRNGISEGYLGGDIAEVIIYNRALSAQEREQVEQHLMSKYGISS